MKIKPLKDMLNIEFVSTRLGRIDYQKLKTYIKSEEDANKFERFFQKLLKTMYENSELAFKKEAKIDVLIEWENDKVSVICRTKNSISPMEVPRFLLYLPSQGLAIKKNLMATFDVRAIFAMVVMNWESINERLNKAEKERRNLIDQSSEDFSKDFKLLMGMVSESRI